MHLKFVRYGAALACSYLVSSLVLVANAQTATTGTTGFGTTGLPGSGLPGTSISVPILQAAPPIYLGPTPPSANSIGPSTAGVYLNNGNVVQGTTLIQYNSGTSLGPTPVGVTPLTINTAGSANTTTPGATQLGTSSTATSTGIQSGATSTNPTGNQNGATTTNP